MTEQAIIPEAKLQRKINRVFYEGKTGKIYSIWILNFLMTIITLGIYRFWGKTRMRKYLVSCFTLDGDRFEYTGTGGELFKGFLKAFPVVVLLTLPAALAGEAAGWPLLFYIPLFYLYGIAVYGAMRYRYSRTRWRGIRCLLRGSMIRYANISAIRAIFNVLTLGFAVPYSDIAKHRYVINNSYFGNVKAEYKGSAKKIYGAHIKSLLMMPFILAIGGIFFAIPIIMEASFNVVVDAHGVPSPDGAYLTPVSETMAALPGLIAALCYLFGVFLTIMLLPASRAIYTAALMREQMRGIIAGDLRFGCDVKAWGLAKLQIRNTFIILFTLGLGTPLVIQRNMVFFAKHHAVIGDLETSVILQAENQKITSGEGFEDMLDVDAGFF